MQTTQVRRPLPIIHVYDVLPPGAVRRSLRVSPPPTQPATGRLGWRRGSRCRRLEATPAG